MKLIVAERREYEKYVASLAEAWIEIWIMEHSEFPEHVASLAEAWIEILCKRIYEKA